MAPDRDALTRAERPGPGAPTARRAPSPWLVPAVLLRLIFGMPLSALGPGPPVGASPSVQWAPPSVQRAPPVGVVPPNPVSPPGRVPPPPVSLDFETYPDGSPTCERCPVTDEFEGLGVVFSFSSPYTEADRAYLIASGAYDPEGEEENHSVTAALTEQGFFPGIVILAFPDHPTAVSFRLRGSVAVPRFSVAGRDGEGNPLPAEAVSREVVRTYRAARGGLFREERISLSSSAGVSRVELDGLGPPGHILLVDDLAIRRCSGPGARHECRTEPGPPVYHRPEPAER